MQEKKELAEREFCTTLRYEPRNRDANYNLGLLLLARNDPRDAITYFSRVQPQGPEVLFNLTQAYLGAGQKEKGLMLARALSKQAKNDVRAHFTLGVLLAKQREYSAASREFEVANSLQPGTFEILYNLGQAYRKRDDNEKALDALGQALKVSPNSVEALYLVAQICSDEGKDLDALELPVKAHRLAPENTDVIFLMARVSMKQSFFEDAIPLLQEGLKVAPKRAKLLAALGECYFMAGRVEEAKDTFRTLIEVDPSARSYAFMALCYRNQGRFDEAVEYLQRGCELLVHQTSGPAIEVFSQGAKRYPNSARLALDVHGRYDESVKALLRGVDLGPSDARAYYFLSKAYDRAPNLFDDVVERFRRYAELRPGDAQATLYYAVSLWKGRRSETSPAYLDQVEALLKRALELDPSSSEAHLQLANPYSQRHQYAEAVPEYQRALKLSPNAPDAHFRLGQAYSRVGEKALAEKEFQLHKQLYEQRLAEDDKQRLEIKQFVYSMKEEQKTETGK
jgi:tetratricopeptide (TPR) repeat protein